jgi:hypothetical protein
MDVAKKSKPKTKPVASVAAKERDPATGEDPRGDAISVAWMLTMMATAGADVLSLVAHVIMPPLVAGADKPGLAPVLPRMLLLIAAMCGVVCLLMTPAVYHFRRSPPPLAITVFGAVASILPVLVLFWLAMFGG